jgi:hypothetical protein
MDSPYFKNQQSFIITARCAVEKKEWLLAMHSMGLTRSSDPHQSHAKP